MVNEFSSSGLLYFVSKFSKGKVLLKQSNIATQYDNINKLLVKKINNYAAYHVEI